MNLLAMVFVTDLDRSIDFYQAIGLCYVERHGDAWATLRLGDALLGLHQTSTLPSAERGRVKLNFELGGGSGGKLEAFRDRLLAAGVQLHTSIAPQPWGRSLTLVDPDGLSIEIAESAG
ncbi:MAG TPA: VOC family protein [Thermomicrobiaceae bacterium]|nr:VOC family protein [Thermomicrobiaceae bacterium]